ncbi:MAG: hypothetical protein ACPH2J_09960 [Akkermansiaceae bacterium]
MLKRIDGGRRPFNALGECLEREDVNGVLGIDWRLEQNREGEEPMVEPEYGVRDGVYRSGARGGSPGGD